MSEKETRSIKHFGILGMHWGHRKSSGSSSTPPLKRSHMEAQIRRADKHHMGKDRKPLHKMSDEEISKLFNSDLMQKKLSKMNKMDTAIRVVAATLLAIHGAKQLKTILPTVHIDYTKWPFKREKTPFYSVKVGKSIARKLLPGG